MHAYERASRHGGHGPGRTRAQRAPEGPQDDLLELQQQAGNAAVARLVQRAPRNRPASTDVADLGGGKRHGRAAPPAPTKQDDIHARVIKFDIDADQALLTIASGPDQGVQVGMSGSLLLADGSEYADFTIERASGRLSWAHAPLGEASEDQVSANPRVVIKASQFESQAGKEY